MMRLRDRLAELGPLRLALLALALALSLFATAPGTALDLRGWAALPTLVLPAAAPLVLFVLLFDILMTAVQRADADPQARRRWQRVLAVEAAGTALLLLTWMPYFIAVLTPAR